MPFRYLTDRLPSNIPHWIENTAIGKAYPGPTDGLTLHILNYDETIMVSILYKDRTGYRLLPGESNLKSFSHTNNIVNDTPMLWDIITETYKEYLWDHANHKINSILTPILAEENTDNWVVSYIWSNTTKFGDITLSNQRVSLKMSFYEISRNGYFRVYDAIPDDYYEPWDAPDRIDIPTSTLQEGILKLQHIWETVRDIDIFNFETPEEMLCPIT